MRARPEGRVRPPTGPGRSPLSEPPTRESLHAELDALFDELWPLPRSITGEGTERTLALFAERMDMKLGLVPSGTKAFDWFVPPVWRCRVARLIGPDGTVIADASVNNLSVVNYSEPVDAHLDLADLQPHLHSLPHLPDAIPYVTSYYQRRWGFCLPHAVRERLQPGTYHARIDSDFDGEGGVPFGHVLVPGERDLEIVFTSYVCHPQMANNELSGPLALLALCRLVSAWPRRRFSYRFVLHPETIGAICYLSRFGELLRTRAVAGAVLTCVGGPVDRLSYKFSRPGCSILDAAVARRGDRFHHRGYDPTHGSDERQYGSPGFKLPIGQFCRTHYGAYAGYHNSLDTKAFMDIGQVVDAALRIEELLREVEISGVFENLAPFGEPQLGRRGLYPSMNAGGLRGGDAFHSWLKQHEQLMWVLNGCDGEARMSDVAKRGGLDVRELGPLIETLEQAGLLRLSDGPQGPAPWRPR
jgi:aminopeptidase-like protein